MYVDIINYVDNDSANEFICYHNVEYVITTIILCHCIIKLCHCIIIICHCIYHISCRKIAHLW